MAETRARDLANLAGAGATSGTVAYHETARGFTLPAGAGDENQVISSDGDGTTQWKTTLSAPTVASVTGKLNEYEDGVTEDGGDVTVIGTGFGNDTSVLSVEISTDDFVTSVSTTSITIETAGTEIKGTFTGAETNYSTINAGETVKVKVTKSTLQSVSSVTLATAVTGDLTFTTTTAPNSTHSGTLATTSLGNYGGQITGGGSDSNTKLLLNFDRGGGNDFEDSSNIGGDGHKVDKTSTGTTIPSTNNAIIKSSPFGDGKSAMFFDGSDDQLLTPNNEDFTVSTGPWSLDFWWLTTDKTDAGAIVGLCDVNDIDGSPINAERAFDVYMDGSGNITWYASDGTPWDLNIIGTGFTMTNNTWVHVAVTYGGTSDKNYRIYFDGSLYQTISTTDVLPSSSGNQGLTVGVSGSGSHTNGYVDELRWVKGENPFPTSGFTPSKYRYDNTGDVTGPNGSTHNTDTAGNTKLLIHSNRTDEGNTTFDDSSASDHNIARTGAIHSKLHGGIAPAMAWPASGKTHGSAGVYFSGGLDFIKTHSSPVLGTSLFTMDFWMYRKGSQTRVAGGTGVIWDGRLNPPGSTKSFYIEMRDSDFKLRVTSSLSLNDDYTIDTTIADETWYHIAIIRETATSVKLYIDGVEKASQTVASSLDLDANGYSTLGGEYSHADSEFTGYIDSFRICLSNENLSGGSLYNDGTTLNVPTKVYGSFLSGNVGTIQLNASTDPATTIDYAELAGGTALSTYGLSLSTSGAITGTLTGLATTGASSGGVIRIRARGDADDNRLTTLGGSSYTGITQNAEVQPVLFNARRYVGNDLARSITGFGFKPDLVWFKNRDDDTMYHNIFDSIRGGTKVIYSNHTSAQNTRSGSADGYITSFDSDGVSITTDTSDNGLNNSGDGIIAWGWKAGGEPSSSALSLSGGIGAGTISQSYKSGGNDLSVMTQSVNQNSGFSITQYTGGSTAEDQVHKFPHNLGGAPNFVIVKATDTAGNWAVWNAALDNNSGNQKNVYLNENWSEEPASHGFIDVPDSTDIILNSGSLDDTNYGKIVSRSGTVYVCYAWKAVAGVSAFGTYEGNGDGSSGIQTVEYADGNEFEASFIMIKNIDEAANWQIYDKARGFGGSITGHNTPNDGKTLWTDDDAAENTDYPVIEILSNGFKQNNSYTSNNITGKTYIYCAFA